MVFAFQSSTYSTLERSNFLFYFLLTNFISQVILPRVSAAANTPLPHERMLWKKAACECDLTLLLQLNGVVPHDNLVLIKMRPDEHGRFGFNVKVRADTSWDTVGKSVFHVPSIFSSFHLLFCAKPLVQTVCMHRHSILLSLKY